MEYTKTFNELRAIYNPLQSITDIPRSQVKIVNALFRSDELPDGFSNRKDILIPENQCFSYPVFTPPPGGTPKVILLLHGLNERSWLKYLVWALFLAENTGSYVILFPLSFHINRSPESWKDPRAMIPLMKVRNAAITNVCMSSFANLALSERLTEDPMRFFKSGYQTATDITKLLGSIREGNHPVIPKCSGINIFAYSIGAFLAEILMMGNPSNLFSDSRLFIFCGGSVFSNMQGTSKLIMDKAAFDRVYGFYLNDFEKSIEGQGLLNDFFRNTQLGLAFRSMIDLSRLKSFREGLFKKLRDQIHSVTLLKDTVIPAAGIAATLKISGRRDTVKVRDFPFTYSHENPFPVLDNEERKSVDECFNLVFNEARLFLA